MDEKITIKPKGSLSLNKQRPELPIDGLPASIQNYINAVCNIYHCPREFVTTAVLATASTAVGKKVVVNEGIYKNPLVLWFVSVARSGSNKSYPMKLVTQPLRRIDEELYAEYKREYDDWKAIPAKDRADEPKCPAIVLDNCTDERRSEILFMNNDTNEPQNQSVAKRGNKRGAIGIYPELKGMFDSKNQYQNGGTSAISKLLRLFDCEDIKVDRKNGFTMLIKDPFFNIIGDLQTGMLRSTFGSELFMTNGLNQRFLFSVAEDIEYPHRSHETLPYGIACEWAQTVRMLYEGIYHSPDGNHYTLVRSTDGEVSLGKDADALYDDYHNYLQDKKATADCDYVASIYSKLQIQVLRYAGIVHVLDLAEQRGMRCDYNIMRKEPMEYAIRCMEYFEQMALLVYSRIAEQPPIVKPEQMSKTELLSAFMRLYPDVSQGQLAKLIGVSPAYISKIKSGKAG